MHIRRISLVGARTERFGVMADVVHDVLGLEAGHRDDGWAVFQLASGDRQQDQGPSIPGDRGDA